MRWRWILCLGALAAACLAAGQDVQQYLRLRKQLGVKGPVSCANLDKLIGNKAIEIAGRVKGTFRVGDAFSILVERSDEQSVMVETDHVPEWLTSNDIQARLLVRARRDDEYASLHATLIAVAPEGPIANYDAAHSPSPAAATSPKGSGVPDSGGLYGPIGRGPRSHPPKKHTQNWNLPMSKATPYYASFIKKVNPQLSNTQAYRIAEAIVGFSLHYGVDARLTTAIVMVESGFDPNNTSSTGAMGLGQLMPDTAKWMGVSNAYDTNDNLNGAVKLLRYHLTTYKSQTGDSLKSLVLALAAYNAGEGAVRRAGGVPYASTERYVERVISLYKQFCGY